MGVDAIAGFADFAGIADFADVGDFADFADFTGVADVLAADDSGGAMTMWDDSFRGAWVRRGTGEVTPGQ